MTYVDKEYYNQTYKGVSINDSDFDMFEIRAAEMINDITMYRVATSGLESLSEFAKAQFKKAVCAQIEYINANGGDELYTGDNLQSAGLGKFNYSASESGSKMIAPLAYIHLAPTGLLYRGM